jgi:hypothetical protein
LKKKNYIRLPNHLFFYLCGKRLRPAFELDFNNK